MPLRALKKKATEDKENIILLPVASPLSLVVKKSHHPVLDILRGENTIAVGTGQYGPFLMYKHGETTAQITTQGHRGTLFSGRFQISGDRGTQLLRAAAPMSKSLGH